MTNKVRYGDEFKKVVIDYLKLHTYAETISKFQLQYATVHRWAKKSGYLKCTVVKTAECLCRHLTSDEKYFLIQLLFLKPEQATLAYSIVKKLHLQ